MRKTWRLRALWIAILFTPFGLWAQTPTGTILGTVSDSSGAVISGAKVTAIKVDTSVATKAVSNNRGYFEIPFLLPGTYQLVVEYTGFERSVRTGLVLDTDQRMEIPVMMVPGRAQQTVTVIGETPLLEPTSSDVGEVVDNNAVVDLPLSNRNLLQLTGMVSGVQDRGADSAPADTGAISFGHWSVNGGLSNTNAFMLDGASAQNSNDGAVTIIPTIDLIGEFKLQTSSMSAEYGRTDGGVLNATTKSGTNSLHGTVYEFWKNRALNANTWISKHNGTAATFTNVNTFGYALGGPVMLPKLIDGRNHLFFFTNYEGYRDVQPSSSFMTVPTSAERTGDFSKLETSSGATINIYDPTTTALVSGSTTQYTRQQFSYNGVANVIPPNRIDPTAKAMMAYYPSPNATPTNAYTQVNNYFTNPSGKNTQNEWSVRIDENLSDTKRFFVRYTQSAQGGGAANYFPNTITCSECNTNGNPAGSYSTRGGGSSLYVIPKNAVAGYTQTITPKTILDLRVSANRHVINRIAQSEGFSLSSINMTAPWAGELFEPQFPPTNITNYQGLGVTSNGDPYRFGDITPDFEGSVTHFMGAHTIKTGGSYRIFRADGLQANNNTPLFGFTVTWTQQNPFSASSTSGWPLASFLLGTPASGTVTIPYAGSYQWFYYAGYVQDDWRASSRLTLNLGLRYNVETPFTEKHNASEWFSPTGTTALTTAYSGAVGGLVYAGTNGNSRYESALDWTNIEPRVGAAYKINGSLVWHGAYGIFHPSLNTSYGFPGVVVNDGYSSTTSMVTTNNGGLTPANYLSNPFPGGLIAPTGNTLGLMSFVGQSVTTQLGTNVVPYIQEYNTGLEYQFKSFFLGASYVGSHGVHQVRNAPFNQIPAADFAMGSALNNQVANPFYGLITSGSLSTATISAGQLLEPFPQFANVSDQIVTNGDMHFNSVQVRAEHRLSRGFSYLVNYTGSKNIGNVSDHVWTTVAVQNEYNPRAERAISVIDVPKEFTAAWIWQLPFGRGRLIGGSMPGYANAFASGWEVTGDYDFVSGNPLAITNSSGVTGFGAGSRPNWNGQNPTLSGSARTQNQWFNTADFSAAPQYTFGNVPPYLSVLRGPYTNAWNTGFFKDTAITEKTKFELRAEFYNLFNHPIWAAPGTSFGSTSFGVVANKAGNRTGQLSAKIIF
jgi:hypothetical protein